MSLLKMKFYFQIKLYFQTEIKFFKNKLPLSFSELFDLKHEGRERRNESQNFGTFDVFLKIDKIKFLTLFFSMLTNKQLAILKL